MSALSPTHSSTNEIKASCRIVGYSYKWNCLFNARSVRTQTTSRKQPASFLTFGCQAGTAWNCSTVYLRLVIGFPLFSSPRMPMTSKNGVRWKRGQSDSFTNRSARNRCLKLFVLLWENHNRKPNVKNKTRSGDSVANVSLRIGPSLKLWSIIEESYCENLDLLLGDFFSHK